MKSPGDMENKYDNGDDVFDLSQQPGPGFFSSQSNLRNKHWRKGFRRSDTVVNNKLVLSRDAAKDCVASAWKTLWNPRAPMKKRLRCFKVLSFLTLDFPDSSVYARGVWYFILAAILVGVTTCILASDPDFRYQPDTCPNPLCIPGSTTKCTKTVCEPGIDRTIWAVEIILLVIFTLEYLIRLLTIHAVPNWVLVSRDFAIDLYGNPADLTPKLVRDGWTKTWSFITSWIGVVDIVSILPLYVDLFCIPPLGSFSILEHKELRIVLGFRIVRACKLVRFSNSKPLLERTMAASFPALGLFLLLVFVLVTIFGTLMYYCEMGQFMVTPEYPNGAYLRPNIVGKLEPSPFTSIVSSIYYVIINTTPLSKAGFVVTTKEGKAISVFLAYAGILCVALPVTIISKHFSRQYDILYENPDATKGVDVCRRMSICRIDELDGVTFDDDAME